MSQSDDQIGSLPSKLTMTSNNAVVHCLDDDYSVKATLRVVNFHFLPQPGEILNLGEDGVFEVYRVEHVLVELEPGLFTMTPTVWARRPTTLVL